MNGTGWEYRAIDISRHLKRDIKRNSLFKGVTKVLLDEQGKDGWELVDVKNNIARKIVQD